MADSLNRLFRYNLGAYASGLDRHSYKVKAGGSNPPVPTISDDSSAGSEYLPYKQRVPGSNPGRPTRDT